MKMQVFSAAILDSRVISKVHIKQKPSAQMKFYTCTEFVNEEKYISFFSFVEQNIFIIFFWKGRFLSNEMRKKTTVSPIYNRSSVHV